MSSTSLARLKCFLMGHSYNKDLWEADQPLCDKFSCRAFRKCDRCGSLSKPSLRHDHIFGDYLASEAEPCLWISACKICGFNVNKEQHGNFHSIESDEPCKYDQVCDLCGVVIGTATKHGSSHAEDTSNPCLQNQVCDQCRETIGQIEKHTFGMIFEARIPVEPDDWYAGKAHKCTRCGYFEPV